MSSLRGRGKVVPRKAEQQQQPTELPQVQGYDRSTLQPSPHAALTVARTVPNAKRDLTAKTVADAQQDSQWRCAAYVAASSSPVQQLSPAQLDTSAGRKLLSSGQPVLIQQLQLTQCRVRSLRQQHVPQPVSVNEKLQGHQGSAAESHLASVQQQGPPDHAQLCDGQQEQQLQFPVLCSPSAANRFLLAYSTKNAPGSYYHIRKPETAVLHMTFAEWLDCWQGWTNSRLLLQVLVCNWEFPDAGPGLRLWPNKAVYPHITDLLQPTAAAAAAAVPTAAAMPTAAEAAAATAAGAARPSAAPASTSSTTGDPSTAAQPTAAPPAAYPASGAQHIVDWQALRALLQAGRWSPSGSLQLLAGGRDALLPASYHTQDRVFCQVSGRQRVLLLPPDLAFHGLYPYPVHHPYDGYSAVDWEEPELEHWPAAAQVKGVVCDLSPGDSLLVPAYWFVHRQLMQQASVSLELLLQPSPQRLSSPPALVLQLSRMMELWFAAEAGPANVRKWLQALSQSREWQLLESQLLTVKGSKLLQCCAMTLEHLQQVLSLPDTPALAYSSSSNSSSSSSSSAAAKADARSALDSSGSASLHEQESYGKRISWAAAGITGAGGSVASGGGSLEAAARQLIGALCDGRLVPTPWLNEGISGPLYLQYPPQYHLLEEEAEAVQYSSLFRHRLIANRPDWMQHAVPLKLAPPGSKRTLIAAAASPAITNPLPVEGLPAA